MRHHLILGFGRMEHINEAFHCNSTTVAILRNIYSYPFRIRTQMELLKMISNKNGIPFRPFTWKKWQIPPPILAIHRMHKHPLADAGCPVKYQQVAAVSSLELPLNLNPHPALAALCALLHANIEANQQLHNWQWTKVRRSKSSLIVAAGCCSEKKKKINVVLHVHMHLSIKAFSLLAKI